MLSMFRPRLSLIAVNLKSNKLQKHLKLIKAICILYLVGAILVGALFFLGVKFPGAWEQLTGWVNGMSFDFSLSRACMPLTHSVGWVMVSVIVGMLIWLEVVRWQFSLLILEGASILSLMYLICSIFYLSSDNKSVHLLVLLFSTIVYLLSFVQYSNIPYYWSKRSSGHRLYGDIMLESLIGLLFFLLVGRTLLMASGVII